MVGSEDQRRARHGGELINLTLARGSNQGLDSLGLGSLGLGLGSLGLGDFQMLTSHFIN